MNQMIGRLPVPGLNFEWMLNEADAGTSVSSAPDVQVCRQRVWVRCVTIDVD